MRRFTIITVAAVFLSAACTSTEKQERRGVRKALKTVEETTEKANTQLGYVVGIAALTPVVFTAALTWNIIAAPLTALNDTFDAAATVYKKLQEEPSGESEETSIESPE
jgi:hypothetical protein